MADAPDRYARGLAMAVQSVLTHLFRHLEEKGVMTGPERNQILADAITDHVHAQESEFELQAQAILYNWKRDLRDLAD